MLPLLSRPTKCKVGFEGGESNQERKNMFQTYKYECYTSFYKIVNKTNIFQICSIFNISLSIGILFCLFWVEVNLGQFSIQNKFQKTFKYIKLYNIHKYNYEIQHNSNIISNSKMLWVQQII